MRYTDTVLGNTLRRRRQDDPFAPATARNMLRIQIFKERDGILPSGPGKLLERGNIYCLILVAEMQQSLLQILQRSAVKQ